MIRAAGALVWRQRGDELELAVVHRGRYDDWSLPKGKLADGESAPAGAHREVTEETGLRIELGRRLGQASYVVSSPAAKRTGPKVVDFWAARATGGEFMPNDEVDQLRWVSPAAARELLSYDFDRDILAAFTVLPPPTATALLVRHGKAGNRDRWPGDDDLRPLSAGGRHQATELRSLLSLFGPSRVYAAPRVRCVQTVQPLAEALAVDIVQDPLLSEEGYWADPTAGLERFLALTAAGGTIAICSQGGVIPDLVHKLAGPAAADEGGTVPARKGSTWVLSLNRRRLLAADHYPPP